MRAVSWLRRKGKAATTSHSGRRLFSHSCEAASNVLTPPDAMGGHIQHPPLVGAHYMPAGAEASTISSFRCSNSSNSAGPKWNRCPMIRFASSGGLPNSISLRYV